VKSGARVIHLLNYDNEHPSPPVAVTLSDEVAAAEARLISPAARPEERAIRPAKAGTNRFEIGPIETYTLLVVPERR
jgi:hypothetical protein